MADLQLPGDTTDLNNLPDPALLPAINLFNYLPVAFYTCNREGYVTSYNRAAAELWGREPEIGKERWSGSWKAFYTDDTPIGLEDSTMARTLQSGVAVHGEEFLIQRPNGEVRIIQPYPEPVFDSTGKLIGATNTVLDITGQKNDEKNQAMLAAIIRSSDDAIISKTLQGIITSWNQAAEKLFGYTGQEVIGKHISILIPADRIAEEELIIGKVRNSENVDHFETFRLRKNGEEIAISLTVSPIKDNKGRIIGASKIARDISKQKYAEARLQRYAENLEILNSFGKVIAEDMNVQAILQKVTDATTQLTQATVGAFFYNQVDEQGESSSLYALSGVSKAAFERSGAPRDTDIFNAAFSDKGILRVDDITKDAHYDKNTAYFGMPEGNLAIASYLAVPVVSKDGLIIGGLFYGHPQPAMFTEEHEQLVAGVAAQAAVALDNAKLYQEIKVLNGKKDEFIGMASHELKTPVTSINGYLQLIERSIPEEDRNKAFIVKARNQVNKLAALIGDLLDVSKIQTGKLPFSYSNFDMVNLITEVTEVIHQTNNSHIVQLVFDNNELPVYADQQRMEQVIINLVSNAIKYSPNANRIIVRATLAGKKVRVSVQDFGIGIENDQHGRIFSRFYRVENLAAHMSGLGIGLYISHEIIRRHKGKLTLTSEVGAGSTFFFEIPVE
ncbi:MAG: PAS domain S-box protein [Mucilaginibacter sp.]